MSHVELIGISGFKFVVVKASGNISVIAHEIILYIISFCCGRNKAPIVCARRDIDKLLFDKHGGERRKLGARPFGQPILKIIIEGFGIADLGLQPYPLLRDNIPIGICIRINQHLTAANRPIREGAGGAMTVVDDDRCGGFRLMVVSCNRNVVEKVLTVVVLIVFPAGKCIAVMLGRCRESCFVESGSDFVLLGSDHGAVKAVNKCYGKFRLFPFGQFNIVCYKHFAGVFQLDITARLGGHFIDIDLIQVLIDVPLRVRSGFIQYIYQPRFKIADSFPRHFYVSIGCIKCK